MLSVSVPVQPVREETAPGRRLEYIEEDEVLTMSPDPVSPEVELSPPSPIPAIRVASHGATTPYERHQRAITQLSLKDLPLSREIFRHVPRASPERRRPGAPVDDAAPFDPFEAAMSDQAAVMRHSLSIHYNPITGDSRVVSCAPFLLRTLIRRRRRLQYSRCQNALRQSGQFKALCDLQERYARWRSGARRRAGVSLMRPDDQKEDVSSALSSSFSLSDDDEAKQIASTNDYPQVKSRSYAEGLKEDRLSLRLLVAGGTSILDQLQNGTSSTAADQLRRVSPKGAMSNATNCTSFTTPTFCAFCGCRFARIVVPIRGNLVSSTPVVSAPIPKNPIDVLLRPKTVPQLREDSGDAPIIDHRIRVAKFCTSCGRANPASQQPPLNGEGHEVVRDSRHSAFVGRGDSLSVSSLAEDPMLMPSADAKREAALRNLWGVAQQQHEASLRHSRAVAAIYNPTPAEGHQSLEEEAQRYCVSSADVADCMTQTNIQFGHLTFIPEPPPAAPSVASLLDARASDSSQPNESNLSPSSPQVLFERRMASLVQSKLVADQLKLEQLRAASGAVGALSEERVFGDVGGGGVARSAHLIDQNAQLRVRVDTLSKELEEARRGHLEAAQELAKELARGIESKYQRQSAEMSHLWQSLNTSLEK